MKIRRSLLKSTVTVETYSGESAYGPIYAAAQSVSANVELKRRLVLTQAGDEAISELTLYVHPDDGSLFTPESLVTYSGHAGKVLSAAPQMFRSSIAFYKVACS